MQEDKPLNFQDLDQVLYNAQRRRSQDLGLWLQQYLRHRLRRKTQGKVLDVALGTDQTPADVSPTDVTRPRR
jgi:hypothetical protein